MKNSRLTLAFTVSTVLSLLIGLLLNLVATYLMASLEPAFVVGVLIAAFVIFYLCPFTFSTTQRTTGAHQGLTHRTLH